MDKKGRCNRKTTSLIDVVVENDYLPGRAFLVAGDFRVVLRGAFFLAAFLTTFFLVGLRATFFLAVLRVGHLEGRFLAAFFFVVFAFNSRFSFSSFSASSFSFFQVLLHSMQIFFRDLFCFFFALSFFRSFLISLSFLVFFLLMTCIWYVSVLLESIICGYFCQ
jgi:hypothetical protein